MKHKTNGHKKNDEQIKVPSGLICKVCKCSPELVRKYRSGKLSGEGAATLRVQIADLLLTEGLTNLVKRVSEALPYNQ